MSWLLADGGEPSALPGMDSRDLSEEEEKVLL